MNRAQALARIRLAAQRDKNRRRDPRYLDVMGLLIAKGFLHTNQPIPPRPNKKIRIDDAVWAGQNVEPRILELLPAAVLRLPNHFDLDPERHPDLYVTVNELRRGAVTGGPLWQIPYAKLRIWVTLPLRDGRIKDLAQKKVTKTFRLKPEAVVRLKEIARDLGCTETEAMERTLLGSLSS